MIAMSPSLRGSNGVSSRGHDGAFALKNLAHSLRDHTGASRRWFAELLWRAFPGASEHEVAQAAAAALGVSQRAVVYWLRGENSASLQYVTAVMLIAGVEMALGHRAAGEPRMRDNGSGTCGDLCAGPGGTSGAASPR